jgi:hypothetical protein
MPIERPLMNVRLFALAVAIGSSVFAAVALANQATPAARASAHDSEVTAVVRTDLALRPFLESATTVTGFDHGGVFASIREANRGDQDRSR